MRAVFVSATGNSWFCETGSTHESVEQFKPPLHSRQRFINEYVMLVPQPLEGNYKSLFTEG